MGGGGSCDIMDPTIEKEEISGNRCNHTLVCGPWIWSSSLTDDTERVEGELLSQHTHVLLKRSLRTLELTRAIFKASPLTIHNYCTYNVLAQFMIVDCS